MPGRNTRRQLATARVRVPEWNTGTASGFDREKKSTVHPILKLVMEHPDNKKPPSSDGYVTKQRKLELWVDGSTTIGWIRNKAKEWIAELRLDKDVTFDLFALSPDNVSLRNVSSSLPLALTSSVFFAPTLLQNDDVNLHAVVGSDGHAHILLVVQQIGQDL